KKPRKCKAKVVTTIHNYLFPELSNYYGIFFSYILGISWLIFWKRFDKIFVLSEHGKAYYSKWIKNSRIIKVNNGIDIPISDNFINEKDRIIISNLKEKYDYIIGIYSALIPRKNVDLVIRHISRSDKGALIVIGSGPKRNYLIKYVRNLKIQSRVIFMGQIPFAYKYNQVFDIFVMPSVHEGFGLSLIEAALYSKKIVCSSFPVFKELFSDNEVTFYDYKNENSIDSAVRSALADNQKPLKAYQKAKEIYSEKVMANNYLIKYKELLI
ncbi:MAG: glycosyltransferase, partial [Bacteroidota bacterium]